MSQTLTQIWFPTKPLSLDRVRLTLAASMSRRSRRRASENSASFGGVFQYDESEDPRKEMEIDRQLIVQVNARNWTKASNILVSLLSRSTLLDSDIIDRVLIGGVWIATKVLNMFCF